MVGFAYFRHPSTVFNIKNEGLEPSKKIRTVSSTMFCGEFMNLVQVKGLSFTCDFVQTAPSYSAELLLDLCRDIKNLFAV